MCVRYDRYDDKGMENGNTLRSLFDDSDPGMTGYMLPRCLTRNVKALSYSKYLSSFDFEIFSPVFGCSVFGHCLKWLLQPNFLTKGMYLCLKYAKFFVQPGRIIELEV